MIEIESMADVKAAIQAVPNRLWSRFLEQVTAEDAARKRQAVTDQSDEVVDKALQEIGLSLSEYVAQKVRERNRARKVERRGGRVPDRVVDRLVKLTPYFLINTKAPQGQKNDWKVIKGRKMPQWLKDELLDVLDLTDGNPTDDDLKMVIEKFKPM